MQKAHTQGISDRVMYIHTHTHVFFFSWAKGELKRNGMQGSTANQIKSAQRQRRGKKE